VKFSSAYPCPLRLYARCRWRAGGGAKKSPEGIRSCQGDSVTPATGALSRGRVKRERRPPNRGINIARGGPSRVRIPNSMSEGRERRRGGEGTGHASRGTLELYRSDRPPERKGGWTRANPARNQKVLSPSLCFVSGTILFYMRGEGRGRLYCFTPSCRRPSPLFYSDFIIYRALAHGKSSYSMQIIRLSRIDKSQELF